MNASSVIAALNHAITLWNVKFPLGTVEYCPYHFIPGDPMETIPPQIAAGAPGTTSVADGVRISSTKMYASAGSIYFQSDKTIEKIDIYDLNGKLLKTQSVYSDRGHIDLQSAGIYLVRIGYDDHSFENQKLAVR